MSSTHISTYHCICSEVLFASTRPLTEFATRQSDHAAICTIINSSGSSNNSNSNHSSNSAGKEEEEERKGGEETKTKNNSNNSILLSNAIAIERKEKEKGKEEDFPCLILKLDDGFEKRYPVQCPRCGVCFAYQLDGSQWVEDGNEKEKEKEKDDDVRRMGRRCDVLYVLREGLVRTEDVIVGGGGDGS